MASYINTNLSSMQAQRSLSTSQASLNSSIQRLSSGLRVNGAKDDAAGLAIATGMDKTMRGQTVAMRNANDAISFSQTTEGALGKVSDTLQRMRELAVQSANGTNSNDQRIAMNTEFKELQEEITRVVGNTEFNGLKVLGTDAKQTFQIGAGTTGDDQISINGTNLAAGTSATKIATATAGTNEASTLAFAKAINQADLDGAGKTAATTKLNAPDTATITGSTIYKAEIAGTTNTISMIVNDTTGDITYAGTGAYATTNATADNFKAALTTVGDNVTNAAAFTATENSAFAQAKETFASQANAGVNILDETTSKDAMNKIDAAIKEINTAQTTQGAAQNRMSSVISTLQVSNENQSAARSRIMDTDFASETANMARSQILQQASTAMLAQANQLPNGVMKLLG